jgi:hypothetical protein
MTQVKPNVWSAADDITLLTSIEKGFAIGEIAEQLGRTMDDCRARLAEITAAADGVLPRETAAS